MLCEDVKEKLVLYIKGELDESDGEIIANHLTKCNTCREEMIELKEIDHYISENISVELAPEVYEKIHTRQWLKYALSAAAVIIISAGLLIFSAENDYTDRENLAWDAGSGINQLEYDYYRLENDVLTGDQDDKQLSEEDIITDSLEDLNSRIDYLEEIQL